MSTQQSTSTVRSIAILSADEAAYVAANAGQFPLTCIASESCDAIAWDVIAGIASDAVGGNRLILAGTATIPIEYLQYGEDSIFSYVEVNGVKVDDEGVVEAVSYTMTYRLLSAIGLLDAVEESLGSLANEVDNAMTKDGEEYTSWRFPYIVNGKDYLAHYNGGNRVLQVYSEETLQSADLLDEMGVTHQDHLDFYDAAVNSVSKQLKRCEDNGVNPYSGKVMTSSFAGEIQLFSKVKGGIFCPLKGSMVIVFDQLALSNKGNWKGGVSRLFLGKKLNSSRPVDLTQKGIASKGSAMATTLAALSKSAIS